MDEDLKATIKGLCDSVKAMQADILTLRGEVTLSDKNLHAGLQVSNSVSGNSPTSKLKRFALEDKSNSDCIEEEEAELNNTKTELFQLSEAAGAFIETAF